MRVQFLLVAVFLIAVGCQPSGTEPMANLAEDQPAQEGRVPDVAMRGSPAVGGDEATGDGPASQAAQDDLADQPPVIEDLSATRGARLLESTSDAPSGEDAFDYQKKWALIVGINYTDHPHPRRLRPLDSAERDAKAVYDTLVTNYGYLPGETAFLLLGSDDESDTPRATKQNIEDHLEILVNATEKHPQQANSVLFYFAGHGENFRDRSSIAGELHPVDTQVFARGTINPGTTLAMATVSRYLENCNAYHKLIILDCCYSGLLFEAMEPIQVRGAMRFPARRELTVPASVGLTAGKREETVPDVGRILEGHSPFTGALLMGLRTALDDTPSPFSSLELYTYIQRKIDEYNALVSRGTDRIHQIPQYGKEPRGEAGDFYFIPSVDFRREMPSREHQLLAEQCLPGLNGRWWFEESPWLIPHVRGELPNLSKTTSTFRVPADFGPRMSPPDSPHFPAPALFLRALLKRIEEYRDVASSEAMWQWFDTLSHEQPSVGARREILEELLQKPEEDRSPFDWHFIAVLHHHFGDEPETEASYEQTLVAYEQMGEPQESSLRGLCHLDYARWALDAARLPLALRQTRSARRSVPRDTNTSLFHIEAFVIEATAHRRLGNWTRVDEIMSRDLAVLAEDLLAQNTVGHPMTAYVYERQAWAAMDQWRFAEASNWFERAATLRTGLAEFETTAGVSSFANHLYALHSEHGLAMAERFLRPRQPGSLPGEAGFRSICKRLDGLSAPTLSEQDLILERSANSRERLGDAYLLGAPLDRRWLRLARAEYTEAQQREQRRDHLGICNTTAARDFLLAGLDYKLAITASLLARTESDVDMSDHWTAKSNSARARAETVWDGLATSTKIPLSALVLRAAANALTDSTPESFSALDALLLAKLSEARSDAAVQINRTDLDVMLFAASLRLQLPDLCGAESDLETLRTDAFERLLEWFDSLDPQSQPVLAYLRQYRELLVKSWIAEDQDGRIPPDRIANILNQLWRTRGAGRFFSADPDAATLIYHFFLDGKTGVVCFVPPVTRANGMRPTVRPLDFGFAQILATERSSVGEAPSIIPKDFADSLQRIPREVVVLWHDRLVGIQEEHFPEDASERLRFTLVQ